MQIGDRVRVCFSMEGQNQEEVQATVIYIHPKRRYFVAEYAVGFTAAAPFLGSCRRTMREAFYWDNWAGEKPDSAEPPGPDGGKG